MVFGYLHRIAPLSSIPIVLCTCRYEQLRAYHKVHGNCNVPIRYKEVHGLGRYVNILREDYKKFRLNKKTSMTQERVDMLEAIGFNWGGTESQQQEWDDAWNQKFEKLQEYREENGDCLVPRNYGDGTLYAWAIMQRQRNEQYRQGKIVTASRDGSRDNVKVWEDRFERLKALGFVFDAHEEQWQANYKSLTIYWSAFGHCNVGLGASVALDDNDSLARWVQAQRAQYLALKEGKKSSMTAERIEQLERLGFEWALKSSSTSEEESGGQEEEAVAEPSEKPRSTRSTKGAKENKPSSTGTSTQSVTKTSHIKKAAKSKKVTTGSKTKKSKVRRDPVTNKPILDRSRSERPLRSAANKANRKA
jgi:hypothetical protein